MKKSLSLIKTSLLLLGVVVFFLTGQAGARGHLWCSGAPSSLAAATALCCECHPHLAPPGQPAACCAFAAKPGGACLEPSVPAELFQPRKRTSREILAQLPLPAAAPRIPLPSPPRLLAAAGIDRPLPVPYPALVQLRTVVLLV
jgi:hypothetical protein